MFDAATLQLIQVNRGARKNLGYSMEELGNLTPLDFKPEFTSESFAELVEPLRTGKKERIDLTTIHRRKDGSLYPVEVHLQLSTLKSAPVFVAMILDITERKQAEAELEKYKKHLEALVKERTKELEEKVAELEHMNDLFVGRELRINELKERVKELELKIDY